VTSGSRTGVFALIGGGGTGGHVYPALALAEELVRRGHGHDRVRFVGARRGLEATAVPAAGFLIDLLPGRGLRRSVRPAALVANVEALGAFVVAALRALRLVRRHRPAVVVGVGGYASLPVVLAGALLGVPRVVHEQNASPGLANRIAVRLGARPAVALPGTPLGDPVTTGTPIRPSIAGVVRRPAVPPLVVVTGGSLGARSLNRAALELYDCWRDRRDVTIHHVSGRRDYQDCVERLAALRSRSDELAFEVAEYEQHMEHLYSAATVMVCRAGAVTVAELAAVGVPAVLVPLPGSPGDHQGANARALAAGGGAVVVADPDLSGARLAGELDRLLADGAALAVMSAAARTLAQPDAAARLADVVEEAARGGR
jgi:UDP-N-acetylglucosamine--N-acetylmuramyl-(pentapeptide) pyrophosphoryl-undecaprenol N-acetylglucosamine transferase